MNDREKWQQNVTIQYASSRDRATAHNVAVRNDGPGTPGYEKKSTGGKGARYAGYGDQGAGNKARRRAGQNHSEEIPALKRPKTLLRDKRMERGGVDGNTRYDKAPKASNTAGKEEIIWQFNVCI